MSTSWFKRQIACCIAALLVTPLGEAAALPLPPAPQPAEAIAQLETDAQRTNDTASPATPPEGNTVNQGAAPAHADGKSGKQAASPAPSADQPESASPPVGTAAAPYVKPEGVPASRPAGAAIAPAKQRRTRSFAIRIGLLVGAGIAIGVVTAASLGSSSRPH